jgi:hypothetical protein
MISKDKQYKTREGQEVRIYATDGEADYPVHGAIKTKEGWGQNCWKKDGNSNGYLFESKFNLIEIVPKVKVWVEYYLNRFGELDVEISKTEAIFEKHKSGGKGLFPNQTHLKLDVFEYEPKPETK